MSIYHRLTQKIYFKPFYLFRIKKWRSYFSAQRSKVENDITKIELQSINIKNLKALVNRHELLSSLPKNSICAEIGVDHGDFSESILKITTPAKLHLIDAWAEDNRYHIGLKSLVENRFKNEIINGTVDLNVGFSMEVLVNFPDKYFDWVYLDTDHTYQTTKAELAILKLKVKSNGIIAGHDYTIGNWVNSYRYGVIEAVNEFCVNENWEMIFLTTETDQYRSFAIRKLPD